MKTNDFGVSIVGRALNVSVVSIVSRVSIVLNALINKNLFNPSTHIKLRSQILQTLQTLQTAKHSNPSNHEML